MEYWTKIEHVEIMDGYMISSEGRFKNALDDNAKPYCASYHSSNGYDYILLLMKNRKPRLYPVDELVARAFQIIPDELAGRPIMVKHLDGNTRNNNAENLEWVVNVEDWAEFKCPRTSKTGEIGNPIKGRYFISTFGRVYDSVRKTVCPVYLDSGYAKVQLYYDFTYRPGKKRNVKVHRAMANSFNIPGQTKEKFYINHINGIPSDNNIKNLEWVTPKQNAQHVWLTQLETNPVGEEHPRAKFTNHQRECYYEIMIALKDIEPYKVAEIIASRLPAITKDDVKYAKQVLKKQRGVIFPLLDFRHPHKYTQEESDELYEIANKIFDKYNIKEKEGYVNEHRKANRDKG